MRQKGREEFTDVLGLRGVTVASIEHTHACRKKKTFTCFTRVALNSIATNKPKLRSFKTIIYEDNICKLSDLTPDADDHNMHAIHQQTYDGCN